MPDFWESSLSSRVMIAGLRMVKNVPFAAWKSGKSRCGLDSTPGVFSTNTAP